MLWCKDTQNTGLYLLADCFICHFMSHLPFDTGGNMFSVRLSVCACARRQTVSPIFHKLLGKISPNLQPWWSCRLRWIDWILRSKDQRYSTE